MLKTRHLRLVTTVAEEASLTEAAKRLFVTQSALSHQLADLERRLGTLVFHRSGGGMRPTGAGRRILESARPVLAELEALEEDLRGIARGDVGRIRVTTQCYTAYRWLPTVLRQLRETHPAVDVQIVPDAAEAPVEAVLAARVDVALAYDFDPTDRLAAVPLFEDDLVLLVWPEHPYADRTYVEAGDFADQHLLAYNKDPRDSLFHRTVLSAAGVAPRRVSEVRLTEGILSLVAAGAGVAVMTRWTAAPEIASGAVRAVQVGPDGLRRAWSAVTLRESMDLPYIVHFTELLRAGPMPLFNTGDPALRSAARIRVLA